MAHQKVEFWGRWLRLREEGRRRKCGYSSQVKHNLYSAVLPSFSWDPANSVENTHHGGIFNLEFSPDGSLLVAATERRSVLVFDPLNHKLITSVDRAHNDCVNYVRFLDSRMFATCSDDTTVALWDVRYLKHKIRSLKGHSNWVKNIEYASNTGLLVTSGFDGSIYTWDINRYSEGEVEYQRVFHTNGLMRMRLTPDNSKMVVCTTGGYLMVIHNLDFSTLAEDLQGFKPNMYRLMQIGNLANGHYLFNHLFCARRNRIELISDFPQGNDAEVISSLQIHPHGWCVLSRNTSSDENSEWTCVHDIQDSGVQTERTDQPLDSEKTQQLCSDCSNSAESPPPEGSSRTDSFARERPVFHIRLNYGPQSAGVRGGEESVSVSHGVVHTTTDSFRFGNIELRISRRRNAHQTPEVASDESLSGGEDVSVARGAGGRELIVRDSPAFFIRTGSELRARTYLVLGPSRPHPSLPAASSSPRKVLQNSPRLTHFAEEPNLGRGFIKELCFSTDGRLICSPFGYGVRLLAFDGQCSELCDAVPSSPTVLHELATNLSHTNYVVSTKFSPVHCLLVSGCLSGKICFHQPVF